MPKCALPPNIDEPSEWKGTDDDVWYMRWRIYCKWLFAFSHRCPKGITGSIVFFPGLYLLPFTIWFTGWSWWYLFPFILIPVAKQWRRYPTVIFAMKGKGPWRLESDSTPNVQLDGMPNPMWFPRIETGAASVMVVHYLSRVQYWTRWHFQLCWPFILAFHFYLRAEDVPKPNDPTGDALDGKLWYAYRGYHRDGDQVFWGDGGFLGRVWK